MSIWDHIIEEGYRREWTGPQLIAFLTLALDEQWTSQMITLDQQIQIYDIHRGDGIDPWEGLFWMRGGKTATQQPILFRSFKDRLLKLGFFAQVLLDQSTAKTLNEILGVVRDVQIQLRGPGLQGWKQLGQNAAGQDLTLVDAFAEQSYLSKKIYSKLQETAAAKTATAENG
jgi:hypothetical protein